MTTGSYDFYCLTDQRTVSGEEWHQRVISQCDAFSNLLLFTYQFDECVVDRQPIELRAVYRTECFKVLQSIHFFKDGSVTAQRGWGVEAARAAATALFAMTCMWRRIRTENTRLKPLATSSRNACW